MTCALQRFHFNVGTFSWEFWGSSAGFEHRQRRVCGLNLPVFRGNKVRWGPGPSPFNFILSHSGDDFAAPSPKVCLPLGILGMWANLAAPVSWTQTGSCALDITRSQVMGMHFKLGLYEHQSAGALEGAINALVNNPELVSGWTPP